MTKSNDNQTKDALISIGGLSRASGVPVETLRNWERRYGFPQPSRLVSGHRRYPLNIAVRLRLIKQVLDLGYKPSWAAMASDGDLAAVLAQQERESNKSPAPVSQRSGKEELDDWFGHVDTLDAAGLEVGFRRAWSSFGAHHFVTKLMVSFFREAGNRWADGQLTVAHEHFASEVAQSFLAGMWRPLSERARGIRVVLANLEGELHSLGLHMAAVFLALNDIEVVFLGPNTPLTDIVTAAREPRVAAVVIGLSAASRVDWAAARLRELRVALESAIVVAFGGNDRLPGISGVQWIESFEEFDKWSRSIGG